MGKACTWSGCPYWFSTH
jgi:hypothetical protein